MGRENTAKTMSQHGFTQFDLSKKVLNNLNNYKLKPTAKLVLLYLCDCYNPKHGEMFPKQSTIADKLGISEVSVTRAIQELHKEGLLISERKYTNRYKFTSRIIAECSNNLIEDSQQKDRKETIKKIPAYKEQTIEQEKEQLDKRLGGNVYSMEEFNVLREYAVKHNAKTVVGYIAFLHYNNSAKSILKNHCKKAFITKRAETNIAETKQFIAEQQKLSETAIKPTESAAWNSLGVKFGKK